MAAPFFWRGAFANVFVFGTCASTLGFTFGASKKDRDMEILPRYVGDCNITRIQS